MPPRTRTEPCKVLRRENIPCFLWMEDAIAQYQVPTCGFDVFLLVSDTDAAADALRRAGWTDIRSADAISCSFLCQPQHAPITHRCLKPPSPDERQQEQAQKQKQEQKEEHEQHGAVLEGRPMLPPPPSKDPPPPTTTVLLAVRDFGDLPLSPLPCGSADTDPLQTDLIFVPPLPLLVDGLIAGVLDAPPESRLETRLALQLGYLYAHCGRMLSPTLADLLRPEHRQFHVDALTGPSVGTSRMLSWNRRVRCELRAGSRELMWENSLLAANPSEYQIFIENFRSEFRPLRVEHGPGALDVPTSTSFHS